MTLPIRLSLPNRNTRCCTVSIGEIDLHFSYQTLIGIQGGGYAARRHNVWGPTTGKHINNDLGIYYLPETDEDGLAQMAKEAILSLGLKHAADVVIEGKAP